MLGKNHRKPNSLPGGRKRAAFRHSIADVDDNGRGRVNRAELEKLLHILPEIIRCSRWQSDRALAVRLWLASGEPNWRPSPGDLVALRCICAQFAADTKPT